MEFYCIGLNNSIYKTLILVSLVFFLVFLVVAFFHRKEHEEEHKGHNKSPKYFSDQIANFNRILKKDRSYHINSISICIFIGILMSMNLNGQIKIAFDTGNKPISFGVSKISEAIKKSGKQVQQINLSDGFQKANLVINIVSDKAYLGLQKEGFSIYHQENILNVDAIDEVGAMYAALEIAEQLRRGKTLQNISPQKINPHFTVRALKFNLPWSSYRVGPAMDEHLEVCRDLNFWQAYIDQMAENRFNILSLWNVHPFSYLVKPTNFPGANNYSDQEMRDWKHFWTSLFRMARDRGIQPFIVNWNIAVSPEFAKAYH